eukprot:2038936-Heterocapsa_arctica.AAC.1
MSSFDIQTMMTSRRGNTLNPPPDNPTQSGRRPRTPWMSFRDSGAKDQGSKPHGRVFGAFPDLLLFTILAACPANSACNVLPLRPVHTIPFTFCL